MDSVLSVKDMAFCYGRNKIFDQVNLEIHKGDYAAIVGDNGVGKSTFLKSILGLLPGYQGEVLWFNQPAKALRPGLIGYVAQSKTFNKEFPATIREVVTGNLIGRRNFWRQLPLDAFERVQDVLSEVGLAGKENCLIGNLSGGQFQRVLIARALVNSPDVLILDEPTVGLDQNGLADLENLLGELNQKGCTIIMVTHHLEWIAGQFSRLLVFRPDGIIDRSVAKGRVG
jgi:zinc transport system ATP-binding protein